jgi:hypothetical protein
MINNPELCERVVFEELMMELDKCINYILHQVKKFLGLFAAQI